ncbi:DUF866-domain-containing protein [Clavulina sp. PMI_390]|nr:DUF866-domain-containing protein [Clavulina sp. PMI_390]
MVKLLLSIKADLDNVTDLQPASESFEYFFKVQCSSCHEEHPKLVSLNRLEEHEVSGGKNATAHFVWRCGECKRQSSAKFDTAYRVKPYSSENSGQLQPLLVIECRGLEFTGFDARGTWKCVGQESGTVFDKIEISPGEPEWTDYDEKAELPVSIMEIEGEWSRA